MNESLALLQHALESAFKMSVLLAVVAACAGISISLVLSAFQIQDQTLPFAVKLIVVSLMLALTARGMGAELLRLIDDVFFLAAAPTG